VTLAPEGGAHQSTVTTSLGVELPGLRMYEPAFAREAEWCLLEAIRGCVAQVGGFSTYLRLTTRVVDQELSSHMATRLGESEWRRQVLAGGYRLIDARELSPDLPPEAPVVNVLAVGAVVPEAVEAVRMLIHEEVAANLIVVTSVERLAAELHERRLAAIRDRASHRLTHLETLVPEAERAAPIVTVADAASHALSFVGSAFGAPVVPLGVDGFGQSGSIQDLYAQAGIDRDHIIEASLLALDLRR
jgi:pyruvate dehydrogenase E1 component